MIDKVVSEMNEIQKQILEIFSESKVNHVRLAIDTSSDTLKYTSWVGALATAGIALIITSFDKITVNSWIGKSAAIFAVIFAAANLFSAIILTAAINRKINLEVLYWRKQLPLVGKQKIKLLLTEDIKDDPTKFVIKIFEMEYLPEGDKKSYDSDESRRREAASSYRRLILIQQILIVLGYVIVFVSAIKNPNS